MKVSLTELVDVVSKAGSTKASQVARIKQRSLDTYKPFKDFYKPLRSALIEVHKCGDTKDVLENRVAHVTEPNRRRRYEGLILQYKRWWGRKDIDWFAPPTAIYSRSGVDISVNPELGVVFGGHRYVVKLYFKADALKKTSADMITCLMAAALPCDDQARFAVLDIERGKFFYLEGPPSELRLAMIDAELAYIAQIWPALGEAA